MIAVMTRPTHAAPFVLLLAALAQAAPLTAKEEKALEKRLDEGVKNKSWDDVATTIEALAEANKKKSWDAMLRAAQGAPSDGQVPAALGRALARMDDKKVREDARAQVEKAPSRGVRRHLVLFFAGQSDWPPVIGALDDQDEVVASTAVRRLAAAKVEAAVEPMIEAMCKLDGTHGGVWDVLRNELGKLLGVRLESGIEYRSKWQIVKSEGGLGSVRPEAKAEDEGDPKGGGGSSVRFFGSQIGSTRVVFVLDISGSMKAVDPPAPRSAPRAPDGSTTRGPPGAGGEAPPPEEKNRLQKAQAELKKVIEKLPAYFKINIIAYDHEVQYWRPGEEGKVPALHALDATNKADALRFVDTFQPRGATATHHALEAAYKVENARLIFLLSDGAPWMNDKPVPPAEVLAVVDRNADKGVVINTMAFPGVPKDMMKQIADKTGGTYRDIQ